VKRKTLVTIISVIVAILVDVTGFIGLFTYAATPGFQLELGQKYLELASYSEAILAFNKVIAINPNNTSAYIGLSQAYVAKNNPEKAQEVLEMGLERTGSSALEWELKVLREGSQDDALDSGEIPFVTARAVQGEGTLSGRVSPYTVDGEAQAIPGAVVRVLSGTRDVTSTQTDSAGTFNFDLDAGEYQLEISAAGYHTLISQQQVVGSETTYAQHFMLIDQQETGQGVVGGTIQDAATGTGISGATIRLLPDWNSPREQTAPAGPLTAVTDNAGYYEIAAPVGYYTAVISKDDYVDATYNVTVVSQSPNRQQNIAITQSIPVDQIRVVLRWGETPRDLDSHLIVPKPDGTRQEIYFVNKVCRDGDTELANLDVDDTDSYGPETVTILKFNQNGEYYYYVHDYSNGGQTTSTAMSYSGATVSVYMGDSLYAEYAVPVGATGTYWTVFKLDSGGLHPINTVTNTLQVS